MKAVVARLIAPAVPVFLLTFSAVAQEPIAPPPYEEGATASGDTLKKPEVRIVVDEPAEFPGGTLALRKFIGQHLVYPEAAKQQKVKGKCVLKFIVSYEGMISHVEVVRGVPDCPECDAEALRVVKLMPAWKPGKIEGKKVNSTFYLPIDFTLQ